MKRKSKATTSWTVISFSTLYIYSTFLSLVGCFCVFTEYLTIFWSRYMSKDQVQGFVSQSRSVTEISIHFYIFIFVSEIVSICICYSFTLFIELQCISPVLKSNTIKLQTLLVLDEVCSFDAVWFYMLHWCGHQIQNQNSLRMVH